jgi:hypothetical protein
MITFVNEDTEKVSSRRIVIPKNAKRIFKAMKDWYSNYVDNTKGGKVLKKLSTDTHYDGKGNEAKKNGQETNNTSITVNNAKVILHRQKKFAPNTLQYQLYGGKLGHDILKRGIERSRAQASVSEVPKVQQPKPVTPPKPTMDKLKPAQPKLNEAYDDESEHPYYGYLCDYDEYYVLSEFMGDMQGKESWGRLIQPEQYKQALTEFTRFGQLMKFPSKYIYQWMGIIMRNTAILRANTAIVGHDMYTPTDAIEEVILDHLLDDYELNDDELTYFCDQEHAEQAEEWPRTEVTEENGRYKVTVPLDEYCEQIGLYNWLSLPDGSDGWSDYGIQPLEKIISQYHEGMSPEETLVLINKALDITHHRGDLASIFIVGGSQALTNISESIQKKVVISEAQINLLKEYRSQLVLPFNGEENGQGHKTNYEHFVDYLEENGRYGTLEAEHVDIDELLGQSVSFENVTDFDANDNVGLWLIGNFVSDLLSDGYDLLDIFSEEWVEGLELTSTTPLEIGQEIVDHLEVPTIDDFEVTLSSDQMCDKFETYAINTLKEMLTEHFHGSHRGYSRSIQVDENGLIEVERAITLPNLASQSHVPGSEFTDFYNYLTKSFKGSVGECWSWSYGDTYDGDDYGNETTTVYLKGKVQPSSVDWPVTVMLNLDLYLNDEDEIRIVKGADVEIDDILGSDHESLGILKQPIICKA